MPHDTAIPWADAAERNKKFLQDAADQVEAAQAARVAEYESACAEAAKRGIAMPSRDDFGLAPEADGAGYVPPVQSTRPRAAPPPEPEPPSTMPATARQIGAVLRPAWCKFHSDAWLSGTAGLTAPETGVYIFICASIMNRGSITQLEFDMPLAGGKTDGGGNPGNAGRGREGGNPGRTDPQRPRRRVLPGLAGKHGQVSPRRPNAVGKSPEAIGV